MLQPIQISQNIIDTFAACSVEERTLLQILSVALIPVSQSVLLRIAREFDACTGAILATRLEKLLRKKLVLPSGKDVACHPQIRHEAMLSLVSSKTLNTMVRIVQSELPLGSDWGVFYYQSPQHALREIRIGFYGKNSELVMDRLARYLKQYKIEAIGCHPFVFICNNPFDPAWFRSLPETLQIPALVEIVSYSRANLLPCEAPLGLFCKIAAKSAPLEPQVLELLIAELLLRGREREAEGVASEGSAAAQSALLGWLALQRGLSPAAVSHYEEAFTRFKKETGKRKTFFHDLTGPFFILALIGSGDPQALARAAEYCAFVVAKNEWWHQDIYSVLQHLIAERSGEPGILHQLETQSVPTDATPLFRMFRVMALNWCASAQVKPEAKQLPGLADRAREAGYLWLADELNLTALACGVETADGATARERYQGAGTIPFCRILERIEPWENALKALSRLNGKEDGSTKAAQTRLIWFVHDERDNIEIQPREQRLSASGKWSQGKNVALKRLAEEATQLDFVSAQDLRICACIRHEREQSHGYYSRDVYWLDPDLALPHMIGHRHVYLDPAGTIRLELVRGEPEIQLSTHGNMLQMQIIPKFEQQRRVYIQKESPTRLKIFEAKDEYKRIAAIVGEGLKFPVKAKTKALEAIDSLSSILTVHSDLESGSAELLPGDATPCLHLLPYGDGVKLDLLVRPFSDTGPYFRPGTGGETVMAELQGKRVQTKRDLAGEVKLAAKAISALPLLAEFEENDGEWLLPAPEAALELLLQLQSLGDSARVAWPEGAKFKVRQEATTGQCKLSIRQAKEWFELDGEIKLNEGVALTFQQLLRLMKETSGRFVPIGDGEYLALSAELRKRLDELAAFAEPHGKGFRFHPLTAGVFEEFASEAGEFTSDKQWLSQLKRMREAQAFRPRLPTTLQAELRGYQEDGFNWLNRLARWGVGACLADDMGLGKTVQALAQILSMAAKGPSLVIAPTSVCMNWESETLKFAPTLRVVMFGTGNRQECLNALKPFDLVVCSYGLLQQEGEMLAGVQWQAVVLDEAQAIKNMATKRSQAAMELKGAFKMVATGTPIENHLGELWNVFRFINPGLLGSLKQFNVKFAAPIEKLQDKKASSRLKKLIQPFILRRTKNQVLEELPSRTEITIKVEMGEEEASFYEALRRSALETLAGIDKVPGKGGQHLKILAELMRLRRACCNPRLILPESSIPSAKLAAFGEIVEELRENRHKALVFSQFVGHLDILRQYVEKAGISYQYLDGSTPPKERRQRVEAFQSGDGDLFLISLKAGGVGLNLTAADYVIHMDPWWNPAVEDQASDRAHRIGQLRPVTIYRLVTKGTIEEKIVGLHLQKRGLADSLLEETDMSGKVSAEELLALLRSEIG